MSFVDIRFLLFLPAVFLLHYAVPVRARWLVLLVASYIFYMAWKPEYGVLLLCITAIDYVCALRIHDNTNPHIRRAWLITSLICNLGILFFFKYFNFLTGAVLAAVHALHGGSGVPFLTVLLPIGISFHVFQSLSYTFDVYRKHVVPTAHFGKFALYVSFFPQLVAGPIERPTGLLRQINEGVTFDLDRARTGMQLIAWGFFKKLVIADNLAPAVNAVYANPDQFSGPTVLLTLVFFSYQIYCDFSGYTDIARGVARLFGYELMLNFNRPYASQSIAEFWRRWHISLSSWFREYVYFPLGGSRAGTIVTYRNLAVTFLLSGLWHGASWTFVVWGGLNALYMIVSDATSELRTLIFRIMLRGRGTRIHAVWRTLCTFALVSCTWVFFRAPDFSSALHLFSRIPKEWGVFVTQLTSLSGIQHSLFMDTSLATLEGVPIAILSVALLETIDLVRSRGAIRPFMRRVPRALRLAVYCTASICILIFGQFSTAIPFIYFQF